jgi:hypothetical protein
MVEGVSTVEGTIFEEAAGVLTLSMAGTEPVAAGIEVGAVIGAS